MSLGIRKPSLLG